MRKINLAHISRCCTHGTCLTRLKRNTIKLVMLKHNTNTKMHHVKGKSVPDWPVKTFTDQCAHGVELSLMAKNPSAGHKPIISEMYSERGQADLINYQSMCYKELRYLLVYQYHLSEFVDCRPFLEKRRRTIARALLEILTLLERVTNYSY